MRQSQFVILMLLGLTMAATPISVFADDGAEAQERLAKRVETLESLVIRNPFRPRETVLARLDAIEAKLAADEKAAVDKARQQGRSQQDLQRTLDAMTKQMNSMDDRMQKLEGTASKTSIDRREVDALKRDLAAAQRTLKTLEDRVRRLEASR